MRLFSGDKPISFWEMKMEILFQQPDAWNAEKLEELFNTFKILSVPQATKGKLAKENQK